MTVLVYDGKQSTLQIKAVLSCDPNTIISKSSSQERYSTMVLVGENANLCRKFDVIKIETNLYVEWGIIVEPTITDVVDKVEVIVGIGTDGLISEAFNDGKVTKTNMYSFLQSQYDMLYKETTPHRMTLADATTFSGYIITTDFDLPLAQMIRQLFRQGIKVDRYVASDNTLHFKPYRSHSENQVIFEINFDDVKEYEVEFSKDMINALRVFGRAPGDNTVPYFKISAYLNSSGSVVYSTGIAPTAVLPIHSDIEVIQQETNESITNYDARIVETVNNILRNQAYSNYISITVDLNDWIYRDFIFRHNSLFDVLGDTGLITLKTGEVLKTVINEIEIINETARLTFGLGNSRLFDRIKGGNG